VTVWVAVLLIASFAIALGTRARSHSVHAAGPNILLILTDDQRWDTLSAMPWVRSDLVAHGVTFTNAFVVNSLCCPSRTSILTGQYSHSTGVYSNNGPYGGYQAFHGDSSTIATWLHAAGYWTGLVGKYLNGYVGTRVPPGWDRWVSFSGPPGYYRYRLNVDGLLSTAGNAPTDYSTSALNQRAVSFLRSAPRDKPLFLYYAPYAPHLPAVPPPGSRSLATLAPFRPPNYDEVDVSDKPAWIRRGGPLSRSQEGRIDRARRDQLATLVAVDQSVHDVIGELSETGRLANTMLVFMSDNGFAWGEHRLFGKESPYEESIRVPMVIRYDSMVRAPRVEPNLALNIDLAPTFAQLAGVPSPRAEGMSLFPLLRSAGATWRQDFLVEHLAGLQIPTYCEVRTVRYVYVAYGTGEEELYDLRSDPYELANVAAASGYAHILNQVRRRLDQLCRPPPPGYEVGHRLPYFATGCLSGTAGRHLVRGMMALVITRSRWRSMAANIDSTSVSER